MAKEITGLDIGSHSIKAIRLDTSAELHVLDFQQIWLSEIEVEGESDRGSSWFDNDFDTLVFYALDEPNAPVDEQTMSLAVPEFTRERDVFGADVAPYLSVLDVGAFRDELQRIGRAELSDVERQALERLERFVQQVMDAGFHHVAFEWEPVAIAGDGTAWRQGREAQDEAPSEEETQVFDAEEQQRLRRLRAIEMLVERGALDTERIATFLPDGRAMTIHVDVPFETRRQVASVLPHILLDRLPMNQDEVVWDFQVFPREIEENDALVGFARKEDISEFLEELEVTGVDPAFVGIPELVLKNALETQGPVSGGTALVDIGHHETRLVIIKDGRAVLSRSFRSGGHQITRSIADAFDVPYEEAEQIKHQYAAIVAPESAPNEQMRALSAAIVSGLSSTVRDLRRSFQSFSARERTNVESVYICGGSSLIKNVASFLESELGLSARRLNATGLAGLRGEQRAVAALAFGTALAWAEERQRDAAINLRQGPFAYRGRSSYLRKQSMRLGLAVAAVLVTLLIALFMQLQAQEAQRNAMRSALATQTKQLFGERITSGKKIQERLEGEGGGEAGFVPGMSAYRLMYELVEKISGDTKLELDRLELDIDRNLVQIMGETTDAQAVDRLVSDLEKLDCIKGIRKDELRVKSEDKAEFELQISSGCS